MCAVLCSCTLDTLALMKCTWNRALMCDVCQRARAARNREQSCQNSPSALMGQSLCPWPLGMYELFEASMRLAWSSQTPAHAYGNFGVYAITSVLNREDRNVSGIRS